MGERMAESSIELRGWHAVVVLAVILGVSGYRISARFPNVPSDGRDTLRKWLVDDYEGRGAAALKQRVADYRAGLPDRPPVAPPTVEPQVEFISLAAHGWRDAMVVRSEVTVDSGPPPDGRPVRYLFLTTKVGGGWMVLSESDSFRYYTVLLR
jgi:hypothetical protein